MAKKKKKKVRVAFRKNRSKRSRDSALLRESIDDDAHSDALTASERVSGKGELTRYRTIVGVESDEDGVRIDVDESRCLEGRFLCATGLNSIVRTADGRRFECTTRRVVRMIARDARNAVVAGDQVLITATDDEYGVVERVEPRRGTISRISNRREHVIVSNVDQVVIVVSAADPPLKPNLIDRFLVSAEKGEVDALICINKVDLVDPVALQPLVGAYARLGYQVVLTSTQSQRGIVRLRTLLANRESVFAGQSGVGKSSLLNVIQPGLALPTAEVSSWTQKGKHTTRRSVLMELDFGGWVVDTPGIRQLDLWDVIPEEVEGFFVEFRPFVARCKFPDCSHTHEENCAVKRAVREELISPRRYDSFLSIAHPKLASAQRR